MFDKQSPSYINVRMLRLFTQKSTFNWQPTIIKLANRCPELQELDRRLGGGFIPNPDKKRLKQHQLDFIITFTHIDEFSTELFETLISIFKFKMDIR